MAELNSTEASTCQDLYGDSPVQLQSNSDIAGVGVILSFLLSAYLPLAFIIVSYLAGVVPIQLLSRADTDFFRVHYRRRSQWHKTLVKAILLFSDQQIVTGIAIMVAVYAQLDSTSIYHFRIAMFLAWMSANTHLTTLVVLRKYLMQSTVLRIWRLTGMTVLYVMLMVAFVPGTLWDWEEVTKGKSAPFFDPSRNGLIFFNPNLPARCIFQPPPPTVGDAAIRAQIFDGGSSLGWICTIILVTTLNIVKAGLLFAKFSNYVWIIFKAWPCYMLEKSLKRSAADAYQHTLVRQHTAASTLSRPAHLSRWARFRYRALVSMYITFNVLMDYIETFIANVLLLAWGTIWGTIQILNSSFIFTDSDSQENFWGFGQVLPVMMLLLPIASVIDSFFGSGNKQERSSRDHVHRAMTMEEAETPISRSGTMSSMTTPQTSRSSSRSSSRSATRARLDRALPPLPPLSETDFSAPPRYEPHPGQPYGAYDEKTYAQDPFMDTLESPTSDVSSLAGSEAPLRIPTFPHPARSPGGPPGPPPRSDSKFELYMADRRTASSKEALPHPSQFIFGRRAASPPAAAADQPLSEYFRTGKFVRPHFGDMTGAVTSDVARRDVLQRYLYGSKWCQALFAVCALGQLGAIATLTMFGVVDKQYALGSWLSVTSVVAATIVCMLAWWAAGLVMQHRLYK